MTRQPMTAGLLPRPVWLLVRPFGTGKPQALGPVRTLERLKGLTQAIAWSRVEDKIEGVAEMVPEGYEAVDMADKPGPYQELEAVTFEQQLVSILWYDYGEDRWDEEKEWNADRWQDVGMLLESFGIEFPGVDAPEPRDAAAVRGSARELESGEATDAEA